MKKSEAEPRFRNLCREWAREAAIAKDAHPSFLQFKSWLGEIGQSDLLDFRSVMGANYDAEAWFDEELKQTWRR